MNAINALLQLAFLLSGCAALIYQSIWTHYLGLTLGHAAYAQSLVLMMFMGGMALGAWVVSRITTRLHRPVMAYASVETLIGLLGLAFHGVFLAVTQWSEATVLPAIGSAGGAALWQWLSAALLITPQTVLLGATFPLMAAGVLRLPGSAQGRTLGGLYFINGLGAALGALLATFVLLPRWGMPGALTAAGWLNLAVAALSCAAARGMHGPESGTGPQPTPSAAAPGRLLHALLAATFLSSAASFAYELGWVRMLNQALGSSLHSFELMLSAFILGLALGGLWVRQVGDRIADLVRYAGIVQVLMALCAMLSVAVLGSAYHWVPWLMTALARSAAGYVLYNVATASIAMVIMVPAAFFAGMTLPLFTAALLRRGAGERAVGQIYAANTLGAILGVLVAAHGLMPLMGVSLMLLLAGALDLAIGLALLRVLSPGRWTPAVAAAGLLGAGTLGTLLQWGLPDRLLQSAGVFRYATDQLDQRELLFYRDGATASISVVRQHGKLVIATNGKPDAALSPLVQRPGPDESTMMMLAALPLAAHPRPEDVALIGWGSGLSTHAVLGSDKPKRVDTIEIEPAMWEGARMLAPNNSRAYQDPRSKVHFEDAREFFARGQRQYDVIISEPSNPWVSGVASLFTHEFYRRVRASLKPGGMLVQWVHSYEMSDPLLAQMIAALLQSFPDSEVYAANSADLVILAPTAELPPLSGEPWRQPLLAAELRRVGMGSPGDLAMRRLGSSALLRTYVRLNEAAAHSDFFPTVSLQAPQERFANANAALMQRLATSGPPVLQVLDCRPRPGREQGRLAVRADQMIEARQQALWALDRWAGRVIPAARGSDVNRQVDALLTHRRASTPLDADSLMLYLANLANNLLPHGPEAEQHALWDQAGWRREHPDLPTKVHDQLALYDATVQRDWPAAEAAASRLLARPAAELPPALREQALVLGMLAGKAQGQAAAVRDWEARWGTAVPAGPFGATRRFLKAWEDGGERACAAASP
ncbi:hypothetical protein [Pelomonas cellulosilytica]|uniref:PABS domain-containing protein n=1 Tax=Pelomonas cellulosilytica TaxID=2906762 RepID=A0ABS8XT65_9BURK|nr:hypothetical protein [Pelomonas sp. P8]MCE4555887.1 hypothetical protein [Pelomonas sp. P8]